VSGLRGVLERHVEGGALPGAVALVAHGDGVEAEAVGFADLERTVPMERRSIFRIASVTKPIVAAGVMLLVEDGLIALDDPVGEWLPELAAPRVVRAPDGPVDDVVPAVRPITVRHLLASRAGYGFPADFSLPVVGLLFEELLQGPPQPQAVAAPEEWMATLGRIPLLHQPGEGWLYNTSSDIQGVLIARVSGQGLPEFLAERIFGPLGMRDTGFAVAPEALGRMTSYYGPGQGGGLELIDSPDGQWSGAPPFPSGAGGLVSTADDWFAFARMLLDRGGQFLSPESVEQMTTDYTTEEERAAASIFLEGQGWGFGGSVDVAEIGPWNVPGRYGWVGGTGTAAHVLPTAGAVTILLTQVQMTSPTPPAVMRDFWSYAAGA